MQNEKNEEIEKELSEYVDHINAYRVSLNTEGVWLFLTTLGCWSVTNAIAQIVAIVITTILFTQRIWEKLSTKYRKPFASINNRLEIKIREELNAGDTQKARLHDLDQIRKKDLSFWTHLKATPTFILSYLFLALTLFVQIRR